MPVDFDAVGERLARLVVENGAPSLAVAVARDGEIAWEAAFGWADQAERRPATPHTPYSLASITKPITSTALLVLVERGLVDLEVPIENYLGGGHLNARAGPAADATVRRVANHSAGLPLHYQFFYEDEPLRPPGMAETMRRYATLVSAPGERYHYSNLGYGLLDVLISRVSGTSYAEFVRREVFQPWGMTRSSIDIDDALAAYTATRYGADGIPYPSYDFDHRGGSAAFASAHDMARFGLAHLGTPLPDQRTVLPDGRLRDAHSPGPCTTPTGGYGIGWSVTDDDDGYASIGHTGGMGGVSTALVLVPTEGIVVAALCNATSLLPSRARVEILSAMLPAYAERRARAEATAGTHAPTGEEVVPSETMAALHGRWEGVVETYQQALPITLEVLGDSDVHVRLGSQLRTLLNRLRLVGGRLNGTMFGDLETQDARRRPHHVALDLAMRDDALEGAAIALTQTPEGEGGAPRRRAGNALSHWVRLERVGP